MNGDGMIGWLAPSLASLGIPLTFARWEMMHAQGESVAPFASAQGSANERSDVSGGPCLAQRINPEQLHHHRMDNWFKSIPRLTMHGAKGARYRSE